MKHRYIILFLSAVFAASSCSFLDVVPDNIATLDMAFNTRTNAEKYLATCYGFVPCASDLNQNSGLVSGGELWYLKMTCHYYSNTSSFGIANNMQNANDPLLNFWSGGNGGYNVFRGIHECNIFLANIDNVPDMMPYEKAQWKAEIMVVKAYLNYFLMLHYGPIPLLKENKAVDTDLEDMYLERSSIDEVTDYCVSLIDDAIALNSLGLNVSSTQSDLGRITLPIAKAIKAKILVLAASPIFNGNEMFKSIVNSKGEILVSQQYSAEKWQKAATALKDAIDTAHEAGNELYIFDARLNYDPCEEIVEELSLRAVITERFNPEIVWALGNNGTDSLQDLCSPHLTVYSIGNRMWRSCSQLDPTLEMVEQFYSKNGLPIDEDMTYDYSGRYELTATPDDSRRFVKDYQTIRLHVDREPRFYAYVGFDGGKWFSEEFCSANDFNPADVQTRRGGRAGISDELYSPTGYLLKKIVSWRNSNSESNQVNYTYSFPIIRLADLYLLYAEALNNIKDEPDAEVYEYVQKVRDRAGLDKETGSLVDTWAKYSNNPTKPLSKTGMMQIIQHERMNELAFEGHRYHDIRRWKLGSEYLATPVKGWSVLESDPEYFYQSRVIFERTFMPRDYLWPIKNDDLYRNTLLRQNPLW